MPRRLIARVLIGLALPLLLRTGASAQQPAAASQAPRPGPAKNFVLPTPTRFTLPNGLAVTLVPFGTVPKVRVQLAVEAGNVYEGAAQIWLADTVGQMLQEGTTAMTADEVARAVAGMGGELSIAVGPDRATIFTDVLSDRGPQALQILADVVQRPRLPEADLARVKANLVRTLAIQQSTPQSIALEKFAALMYGEHPYGRIFPTEAMLTGYTLDDVKAFHQGHYGPKRARLYVAGVFDAKAVEAAIRAAFGPWTGGLEKAPPLPAAQPARLRAARSSGGAAVHGHAGFARPGSVESGLDWPRGDRLAAGRLVRLPDHGEHPRAEGVHVFAQQHDQHASRKSRTGWSRPTSPPTSPARP